MPLIVLQILDFRFYLVANLTDSVEILN